MVHLECRIHHNHDSPVSMLLTFDPVWQVCNKEEQEVLNRGSKKSERLRQTLLQRGGMVEAEGGRGDKESPAPSVMAKMEQGLSRAMTHRDTLLKYDKTW